MSVVTQGASQVPALAPTPAFELDANDFALSRLYVGQYMSPAVQNEIAKAGDFFVAEGGEDPDAEVLWSLAKGTDPKKNPGVLLHVLGLTKKKSKQVDGKLELFEFNDAPIDAQTTYNFMVCLPEVDADLPVKWLLKGKSSGAAKKIIKVIVKAMINQPIYGPAFRITSKLDSNDKGKFAVVQASPVTADPAHVEIAAKLFPLVESLGSAPIAAPRGDQPSI